MPQLYMILAGCSPAGRNIEQHDVFFFIADHIRDALPALAAFWPEAKKTLHLDAWRIVSKVGSYRVSITEQDPGRNDAHLFFINLGGYKAGEFEEFHYKMLVAATDKNEAMKQSKRTAFFRHTGFKTASAHIDDKYGVDVDDLFLVKDILPASCKSRYRLVLEPAHEDTPEDQLHLGYFKPDQVEKWGRLSE